MTTAKNIPTDLQALAPFFGIQSCNKTECILGDGQRLPIEEARKAAAFLNFITNLGDTVRKAAGRFAASAKDFLANNADARMRKLGEAFLGLEKCIGQRAASECLARCTEDSINALRNV